MAVGDVFVSTSNDIYVSTSDDVWFGIVEEVIGTLSFQYAVRKFYCTLTGTPDGESDIEIPISSFQGRRRNGASTYLSVVTHDLTYEDAIAARPNGEIYIEMAYDLFGTITDREEIIRCLMETIVVDEGAKSQAITLSGTKEESWIPKLITLSGHYYKKSNNGELTFRFADVNVYVHPGDTVTIGADSYTPSLINMTFSATSNGINGSMELTE